MGKFLWFCLTANPAFPQLFVQGGKKAWWLSDHKYFTKLTRRKGFFNGRQCKLFFFFKARKCFSLDFSGGWKIRNHMLICLHTWPDFSFPWENGRTGTRACERGRIFLSELLLVLTGAPTLWQHNGKVPLQSTHQSTHYAYVMYI